MLERLLMCHQLGGIDAAVVYEASAFRRGKHSAMDDEVSPMKREDGDSRDDTQGMRARRKGRQPERGAGAELRTHTRLRPRVR